MKLFCSACQKDVSDNIAVYENVEGVLAHCGDCNYPLLFIAYGEETLLNANGALSEGFHSVIQDHSEEQQLDLYDDDCTCSGCDLPEVIDSEDISFDGEEQTKERVVFTNEDIDTMDTLLSSKVNRLRKSLDKAYDLLEKLRAIQELRQC